MSDQSLPHMTNIKELVETGPIAEGKAKRSGGRRARIAASPSATTPSPLIRHMAAREILGAENRQSLHEAALHILAQTGVEMRHPEVLEIWQKAGAAVEGAIIRPKAELIESLLAGLPSQFSLGDLEIGGDKSLFAPGLGALNVIGTDGARREASQEDQLDCLALVADAQNLDFMAGNVTACSDDEMMTWAITQARNLSAKPIAFRVQNTSQCRAAIDAAADRPLLGLIGSKAPLLWEEASLAGMMELVRSGHSGLFINNVLAGATSPAHAAASLAMIHAGSMAILALSQLLQPVSGHIAALNIQPVNMRSGAPMIGTADAILMRLGFGELARHGKYIFGLGAASSAAKSADAQAGFESGQLMQSGIDAGAHILWDAAGMLENSQCFSLGKFMLDCDLIENIRHYAQGLRLDGLQVGLAVIDEVGTHQHFLGTSHTLENFRKAFHVPQMLDYGPFEQWEAEGARDADMRAREMAGYRLADIRKL